MWRTVFHVILAFVLIVVKNVQAADRISLALCEDQERDLRRKAEDLAFKEIDPRFRYAVKDEGGFYEQKKKLTQMLTSRRWKIEAMRGKLNASHFPKKYLDQFDEYRELRAARVKWGYSSGELAEFDKKSSQDPLKRSAIQAALLFVLYDGNPDGRVYTRKPVGQLSDNPEFGTASISHTQEDHSSFNGQVLTQTFTSFGKTKNGISFVDQTIARRYRNNKFQDLAAQPWNLPPEGEIAYFEGGKLILQSTPVGGKESGSLEAWEEVDLLGGSNAPLVTRFAVKNDDAPMSRAPLISPEEYEKIFGKKFEEINKSVNRVLSPQCKALIAKKKGPFLIQEKSSEGEGIPGR